MGHSLTHADHPQQINSLQTRREPLLEASEWFDAVQSSVTKAKLAFIPLLIFGDEAAQICSASKTIVEEGLPEEMLPAATFTIQACIDLESRMAEHFGQLAACPLLDPVSIHATADRRGLILQYRVRNYVDACFLRLYYSILELLFHAAKSSEISVDQREEIARLRQRHILQSQARADRILTTLPLFLAKPSDQSAAEYKLPLANWADSMRLLWQIRLIASSPVLLERQKSAAQSALLTMGYEVGLMQAMGSYYLNLTAYDVL